MVTKFKTLSIRQRHAALREEIGPRTDSALELHQRALLITRLRGEELWPPEATT